MVVRFRAAWLATLIFVSCKDSGPAKKPEPEGLARVQAIKSGLPKVRGLAFTADVTAGYQTADEFRAYMRRGVKTDRAAIGAKTQALIALGLLPPSANLAAAIENAYATQAAAYYDPGLKQFFLVMAPQTHEAFDILTAHELTHALQDQHFDITRYLLAGENDDARAARRFVTEGDAMLSSIAYLIYSKTNLAELTRDQIAAMRPKLEEFAAADPHTMAAMIRQQATGSNMDPQIQKSLDAFDQIPPTVLVPLLDAYMQGAVLALDAYERGGWRGVDALYKNPPESTEQVLHPKERFLAGTDHPKRVTLPTLDGYSIVSSDVIGELQWSIYFSLWKHTGNGEEHRNWGGDRYVVLRRDDDKLISLIATAWDGEYDAKVFADAYASTIETRYGGTTKTDGSQTLVEHGDDATWILRMQNRVLIVDGGLDSGLLDALIDGTKFE